MNIPKSAGELRILLICFPAYEGIAASLPTSTGNTRISPRPEAIISEQVVFFSSLYANRSEVAIVMQTNTVELSSGSSIGSSACSTFTWKIFCNSKSAKLLQTWLENCFGQMSTIFIDELIAGAVPGAFLHPPAAVHKAQLLSAAMDYDGFSKRLPINIFTYSLLLRMTSLNFERLHKIWGNESRNSFV